MRFGTKNCFLLIRIFYGKRENILNVILCLNVFGLHSLSIVGKMRDNRLLNGVDTMRETKND